ncbi:hypothetical protein JH26_28495 [Microvirga sp. BSC39]|nr:hypothetical protein JH26_28495 [Microvirga sp. BSC39]
MSFEIAAARSAQLMAVIPIDPFAPTPHFSFSQSLRSWVEDVDLAFMHGSARSSIEQFETHGLGRGIRVSRVIGGPDIRELTAKVAEADLVLIPANVGIDGSRAEVWSEVAEVFAQRQHVPILRVLRRPLQVKKVVLVVSSTRRCSQLARRLVELDLWPEAAISILPIGDYRPRVSQGVREQLDLLRTSGRDAALLPAIDLDFAAADLEQILSPFQVAVMGHLSYRAGWFDSVRHDPFEAIASYVPVVLMP